MKRITIYIVMAFLLFYVGDTITTYYAMLNGGQEANSFLRLGGLTLIIGSKIIYLTSTIIILYYLNKQNYQTEMGIVVGAQMAIGVFTILNNLGFYKI